MFWFISRLQGLGLRLIEEGGWGGGGNVALLASRDPTVIIRIEFLAADREEGSSNLFTGSFKSGLRIPPAPSIFNFFTILIWSIQSLFNEAFSSLFASIVTFLSSPVLFPRCWRLRKMINVNVSTFPVRSTTIYIFITLLGPGALGWPRPWPSRH